MKSKVDGVLLAEYRQHVASYRSPACGCSLYGPDRECDIGYALFCVATRNGGPVHQDAVLSLMRR